MGVPEQTDEQGVYLQVQSGDPVEIMTLGQSILPVLSFRTIRGSPKLIVAAGQPEVVSAFRTVVSSKAGIMVPYILVEDNDRSNLIRQCSQLFPDLGFRHIFGKAVIVDHNAAGQKAISLLAFLKAVKCVSKSS